MKAGELQRENMVAPKVPWIRIQGVGCLVFEGTVEDLKAWWRKEFNRDFDSDYLIASAGNNSPRYFARFVRSIDCQDGTGPHCYSVFMNSRGAFEVERYVQ